VHALFVKKEVGRIFDHRSRFLERRFGPRDGKEAAEG
jgi:hypothetical protein